MLCYTASMKNTLKKIHPLFAFYIAVSILTYTLIVYKNADDLMTMMNYFMGFSFIGLAFLKIVSLESFAVLCGKYDVVAKKFPLYSYAYPFIELTLGFWFLFFGDNLIVDSITLIILLANFVTILNVIIKKEDYSCACLGGKFVLKFDLWLLLENIAMIAMIVYMMYAMIHMESSNFLQINGQVYDMGNMKM